MYAAIQGLVEELKDRDAQHTKDLSDRDAKIGELEASSAELKAKMEAMEERINSLPPAR
jgi:FtsZ-binding cell division protein ZapB